MDAATNSGAVQSEFLRPISEAHASSIKRGVMVQSVVSVLLSVAGPLAIVWTVTLGIVDALKRQAVRAVAHVGIERREVVSPSVAHRDAARSVAVVVWMVRVVATLTHGVPRPVLTLLASSRGAVVARFVLQASAAFRFTEVISCDTRLIPAGALTQPFNVVPSSAGWTDASQHPARLSSQVNSRCSVGAGHKRNRPILSEVAA